MVQVATPGHGVSDAPVRNRRRRSADGNELEKYVTISTSGGVQCVQWQPNCRIKGKTPRPRIHASIAISEAIIIQDRRNRRYRKSRLWSRHAKGRQDMGIHSTSKSPDRQDEEEGVVFDEATRHASHMGACGSMRVLSACIHFAGGMPWNHTAGWATGPFAGTFGSGTCRRVEARQRETPEICSSALARHCSVRR